MKCRDRYQFRPQLEALEDRLPPSDLLGTPPAPDAAGAPPSRGRREAELIVIPPRSHAFGQTYGQWSASWWQWALGQPVSHHPVLDETGADAAVGQTGHVWFLAGNFGGPVLFIQPPLGVQGDPGQVEARK